jgi:hypothetical protein
VAGDAGVGDDLAGGLEAVHAGHLHVHADHVGIQFERETDAVASVRRFAHHLDARFAVQDDAEAGAH